MDDLNKIQQIRKGTKLTTFNEDDITPIMVLAALDVRDAWNEVPERLRNRRFSKMAVAKNFKNLEKVSETNLPHCAGVFAAWASKLTRKQIDEYRRILNSQNRDFIANCMRQDNRVSHFVDRNKLQKAPKGNNASTDHAYSLNTSTLPTTKNPISKDRFYVDPNELSSFDFTGTDLGHVDELTPEAYLARPVEQQTIEALEQLLTLPDKFPFDFIDRLQMPYRNAAFYHAQGDAEKEALWKAKQIPWLNKAVCVHIAQMHPEASVKTPGYLTKEDIAEFWQWTKENEVTARTRTEYFLGFPAEMLTPDMLEDIDIDWQVIRHTPDFFLTTNEEGKTVFTEPARKYLNKHPNDVFRLPKQFQTITKIIADGTNLNLGNIVRIEDEQLRELIACAMGLELPKTQEQEKEA